VLLLGETGTGKDVLARRIHDRSPRRDRMLVTVNCAALPAGLIESELFGYERGAFTGALHRTQGRFELANGGTIFLDEIGELPLETQPKLLRVLQSGEFERLGANRTIRVDVRLIAATNRDLEQAAREGRFRADLFYRLSVFPLCLPPLRERVEDIRLLVWHFIQQKQASLGRSIQEVPDVALRRLQAYAWPGNVRELENVVERALIMSTGPELAVPDLGRMGSAVSDPTGQTLEDIERAHIVRIVEACHWKLSGPGNAADRLGLNRSTLQFRMKKLGIERPATTRPKRTAPVREEGTTAAQRAATPELRYRPGGRASGDD
jgi:formate hydrogenlyase transcriptional activator